MFLAGAEVRFVDEPTCLLDMKQPMISVTSLPHIPKKLTVGQMRIAFVLHLTGVVGARGLV